MYEKNGMNLFKPPILSLKNMYKKKMEGKDKASFDTPLMIQNNAESTKKIVGNLLDLPDN